MGDETKNSFPQRKHIRLRDYDYSQNGFYFVTICTQGRKHIFGKIDIKDIQNVGQGLCPCRLSPIGYIIQDELNKLSNRFKTITIDGYVIMPNHIHAIIAIKNDIENYNEQLRQGQSPCPTTEKASLYDVVGAFKSITTKRVNSYDNVSQRKIWQFRYYDNVIRNKRDYEIVTKYIQSNPAKWLQDRYYTDF